MGKFSFPGLTSDQVEKSRQKNGTNELPPPEIETFWEKLVENFQVFLDNIYKTFLQWIY